MEKRLPPDPQFMSPALWKSQTFVAIVGAPSFVSSSRQRPHVRPSPESGVTCARYHLPLMLDSTSSSAGALPITRDLARTSGPCIT